MKKKIQIVVSLFSVIVSAFALTSLTMAWINTNENVDRVQIVTGEGVFEVHAGIYDRHYDEELNTYVGDDPNFEPDYEPEFDEPNSSNEALVFKFEQSVPKVALDTMVFDEHSLNVPALPSYVFELHAHTILDLSYIRLSANEQPFPGTPRDFSLYTFQFLVVDNNPSAPMQYAAPFKLNELEARDPFYFNGTNPILFTDDTNATGVYEVEVGAADTVFYSTYFAKSILVLLQPDPVAFYRYLIDENLNGTETKSAGINFEFKIEFSLVPFEV